MSKKTIYLKECWYKLEYEKEDSRISFEAYKILAMNEYNIEDSECEVEPQIVGYIKFDGCMEFKQDDHYSDVIFAKQTYHLMLEIYKILEIAFPDHH